jgi:phospholipid N-methyltransferase
MLTRDGRKFLMTALRKPGSIGAVVPSSPVLARRMLDGLDLAHGRCVIELGPGTGPFTKQIATRLADPSHYLGVELDTGFVAHLRERYPQLRFVHGSAEQADRFAADAGLDGSVAAILCGLPFASLPARVQDGVADALDRLMKPGVVFRTFQYVHAWPLPSAVRFRHRMNQLFGRCTVTGPVVRNVPPALILSWRR